MASREKLREQATRGAEAQSLLGNKLIGEFFDKAKQVLLEGWATTVPDEQDFRERLYDRLQALEDIRACFELTITTGEFARKQLLSMEEEDKV